MPHTQFFQQLVRTYSNDLFRLAFWLSGDKTVAEDLVQETFARAWKAIDRLENEQAAKAWLITILRRENARRFEKQQPHWVALDSANEIADSTPTPAEQLEQRQLHQAIYELPVEFREPLLLQVVWGYQGDEIAEMLDLKLATVNTRLYRARQQLKKTFEAGKPLSKGGRV